MAFTDNCAVVLDVNEAALNRVLRHFRRQPRPRSRSQLALLGAGRSARRVIADPVEAQLGGVAADPFGDQLNRRISS